VPAATISTRGLVVRIGERRFVVPIAHVLRTLRVRAEAVRTVDGVSVVTPEERGEPLRLRWLASAMGAARQPDGDRLVVIVLGDGTARVGWVVDDVEREIELVTKPLPPCVPAVPGVAGAVVHVDGSVAPVLDAPHLVREGASSVRAETVVRSAPRPRVRVLVVDDSLTSRTLERNVLTSAGYEVTTAVDGEAGWELLTTQRFDLVVSDVQMPKLGGLDLLRRVRAHPELRETPVVLVTSLDAPEDVQAGAAAGADAYVVKGRFDQRELLETVARLT
jgi:two-component system chemotaxis sensor kinase CheA